MDITNQEIEKYPIPFKKHSSYKLAFHLLFLFLVLVFGGFLFIPLGDEIDVILIKLLGAALCLFFAYPWLYNGILKKGYIELTEDYIKFKHAFGTKMLKWKDIYDIQVYTLNSNTILGIISKEKMKKRKDSFATVLSDMFGGAYSMGIPMAQFGDVDLQKLYAAALERVKNSYESSEGIGEPAYGSSEPEGKNNLFLALGASLLVSVAVGMGYGLTRMLRVNIIFIPILGSLAVIYAYHKYYKEERINILVRLVLGLICSLQVFIATITSVFFLAKIPVNVVNIVNITKEYFMVLVNEPFEWLMDIVMALLIFSYAAAQGYTFKAQRWFKKLFMKRGGKHYYSREGRVFSIFLIDPVEYNEQKEGNKVGYINEGCFIEVQKKRVTGLYIPVKYLEQLGGTLACDGKTVIGEDEYCVIDLGGKGNYKPYVYPCYFFTNSNNEVELIKVEI